jgi:putative PIN family toxin of toxin-antitoxin system
MALDAALDGRVELVTSPKLLAEVADVLRRPRRRRYLSTEEATRYVDDLAALTVQLNDPAEPHAAVCRDPRDDYLVALARLSGADALVTGDLDLLAIYPNELENEILTPRLLVERLAAS